MIPRAYLPEVLPGGYTESTECSAPGCGKVTRDGKPYCSNHVLMMDYARRLAMSVGQREWEITQGEKGNLPPQDGVLIADAICLLEQHGRLTIESLSRRLGVSKKVVRLVVSVLTSMGRIGHVFVSRSEGAVQLIR